MASQIELHLRRFGVDAADVGGDAARSLGPNDARRFVVTNVDARAIDPQRAPHQGHVPRENCRPRRYVDLELVGRQLERVAPEEGFGRYELGGVTNAVRAATTAGCRKGWSNPGTGLSPV